MWTIILMVKPPMILSMALYSFTKYQEKDYRRTLKEHNCWPILICWQLYQFYCLIWSVWCLNTPCLKLLLNDTDQVTRLLRNFHQLSFTQSWDIAKNISFVSIVIWQMRGKVEKNRYQDIIGRYLKNFLFVYLATRLCNNSTHTNY